MEIKSYILNFIKNQGKAGSVPAGNYNTKLDTEGITSLNYTYGIKDLIKEINVDNIDFSTLTTFDYLFSGCKNIEKIEGNIVSGLITSFSFTFSECAKLTSIDLSNVNTRNSTVFTNAFNNCTSLVDINFGNNFTFESVTGNQVLNFMFTNCTKLSDDTLNNFLRILLTATSYTGSKNLSTLGMVKGIANKCTTLSNWADCQTAGWTTGY